MPCAVNTMLIEWKNEFIPFFSVHHPRLSLSLFRYRNNESAYRDVIQRFDFDDGRWRPGQTGPGRKEREIINVAKPQKHINE